MPIHKEKTTMMIPSSIVLTFNPTNVVRKDEKRKNNHR